jgi:hypothetical protein
MPQWQQGRCTDDGRLAAATAARNGDGTIDMTGSFDGGSLSSADWVPDNLNLSNSSSSVDLANPSSNPLGSYEELVSGDELADPSNSWDTAEKWALPILAAAITTHVVSLFTTGLASGPPDAGDGLAAGVDAFQGASEILGSAGSDPGWQGPAAQSYNARNTEQQTRTNQMAALDTDLATLLQTQAAEVEKLRKDMYIVLGTLTSAKPIAMMLYKTPAVGPQLSTTYQIATAGACLTTTTGLLSAQRVRSNKTGAALNNVAESYGHIADAAQAARPLHS